MGTLNATVTLSVSDSSRRDSERAALGCLPYCPKCSKAFTLEAEAVHNPKVKALVFGSDLGHVDAVCFRCMIGVNVKGNSEYSGSLKVRTAPAAREAFKVALKLFGKANLYLFYGNADHNAFLSYSENLIEVKASSRVRRGGATQERVTLVFGK